VEGHKIPRFDEMKTRLTMRSGLASSWANKCSARDLVLYFCALMAEEFSYRRVNGLEVLPLSTYYRNMFGGDNHPVPVGAKGYSHRLIPAIDECRKLGGTARILDAGSGYGTESLLFSLLGSEVIGVELVSERARIAESRIEYFASLWDAPLRIQFLNANIFRYLESAEPFDIIWIMEAISHIHPPEAFLELVGRKLKKRGKVIISDPNALSPLAWFRSVKIRGSFKHKTHQLFKDPETGIPVDYGQERIFSPFRLREMLSERGFKVNKVSISGFMGSSFIPNFLLLQKPVAGFLSAFEEAIGQVPLINSFGSVFTLVASKEG
jgi:SAM-dependent methyltransferase